MYRTPMWIQMCVQKVPHNFMDVHRVKEKDSLWSTSKICCESLFSPSRLLLWEYNPFLTDTLSKPNVLSWWCTVAMMTKNYHIPRWHSKTGCRNGGGSSQLLDHACRLKATRYGALYVNQVVRFGQTDGNMVREQYEYWHVLMHVIGVHMYTNTS